jgi:hypothetical protein
MAPSAPNYVRELYALLSVFTVANEYENVFHLLSKKSPSKIWG